MCKPIFLRAIVYIALHVDKLYANSFQDVYEAVLGFLDVYHL